VAANASWGLSFSLVLVVVPVGAIVRRKGLNFFEIYKTKTTISFDIGDVKGRPALLNIQGVEVFHGYHYVPKTDYGPN
jgi:hypothetical protein